MRFAVDAHAIGRHLTGNEVYVRSLLNAFGTQDRDCEFIAYVSAEEARSHVPSRIRTRRIARNPFLRLGFDRARPRSGAGGSDRGTISSFTISTPRKFKRSGKQSTTIVLGPQASSPARVKKNQLV